MGDWLKHGTHQLPRNEDADLFGTVFSPSYAWQLLASRSTFRVSSKMISVIFATRGAHHNVALVYETDAILKNTGEATPLIAVSIHEQNGQNKWDLSGRSWIMIAGHL